MKNPGSKKLVDTLKNNIISLLKENLLLKTEIRKVKDNKLNTEKEMLLDILNILDSLQLKITRLNESKNNEKNQQEFEKAINSFNSIIRIIENILSKYNVTEIILKDNKATPELCKIIETQFNNQKEHGTVIEVIRKGYKYDDKILRPAEVITTTR